MKSNISVINQHPTQYEGVIDDVRIVFSYGCDDQDDREQALADVLTTIEQQVRSMFKYVDATLISR